MSKQVRYFPAPLVKGIKYGLMETKTYSITGNYGPKYCMGQAGPRLALGVGEKGLGHGPPIKGAPNFYIIYILLSNFFKY